MTLREYYQQLKHEKRPPHPARQFILTIAEKTGRSPKTIQNWISGIQYPCIECIAIISQELGIPPEQLFPMEYNR